MTFFDFMALHTIETVLIIFSVLALSIVLTINGFKVKFPFLEIERSQKESNQNKEIIKVNKNLIMTRNLYAIDWEKIFLHSNKIECMFVYNRTWRGVIKNFLEIYSKKNNASFHVYLPNTKNKRVINELSIRFKTDPETLIALINDVKIELETRFKFRSKNFVFEIIYFNITPLFIFT